MKQKSVLALMLLVVMLILLFAGCDRRRQVDMNPTIVRLYAVLSTKESLPQVTNLQRGERISANLSTNGGEYQIAFTREFGSVKNRLVLVRTELGVTRGIEMNYFGKLFECTGGGEDWSSSFDKRGDPMGVKQRCMNRGSQWLDDIRRWLDYYYPKTGVLASPTSTPLSVD